MSLLPFQSIFTLLRLLAVTLLVIAVFWLFVQSKAELKLNELELAVSDLAEDLSTHGTVRNAVFDAEELNAVDNTIQEPFARHCSFGYDAKIEVQRKQQCSDDNQCQSYCNLIYDSSTEYRCNDNVCECKNDDKWTKKPSWSFGYSPGKLQNIQVEGPSADGKYPIAVFKPHPLRSGDYDNDAIPATLVLRVHDTWLTRATCMIENAYKCKQIQEEIFDCPDYLSEFYGGCGGALEAPGSDQVWCSYSGTQYMTPSGRCGLTIKRNSTNPDDACIFYKNIRGEEKYTTECRTLDANIEFYKAYTSMIYLGNEAKIIKAVTKKSAYVNSQQDPINFRCDNIPANQIAGENDDVGTVRLCFEDIP